jgi:hypothetical protein
LRGGTRNCSTAKRQKSPMLPMDKVKNNHPQLIDPIAEA